MSQAKRVLLALAAGLVAGAFGAWEGWAWLGGIQAVAGAVGGMWLDALRVTILPLVFALVVTGMAAAAGAGRTGRVAGRAIVAFIALLAFATLLSALLVPPLLALWTPAAGAMDSLRVSLGGGAMPEIPPMDQWFRALVPTNIVAAAAADAIVGVVLFALAFGVAATRLPERRARPLIGFFELVAETMLVIVGWILWLAPLGVFALAFLVGSRVGLGAAAALLHYVGVQIALALLLVLAMYPLVAIMGRVPMGRFARALAPAQAVAASTQSSVASLPPMLESVERMGVAKPVAAVVLPLAVATFKITAASSIIICTLTLARLSGVAVGPAELAIVCLFAMLGTLMIVGLPGQVSFVASMTPPALAIGVPLELLPLLLAVDTIPDIFRTVANVSADVAATAVVAARSGDEPLLPIDQL